jgi:hypothetical protein
MSLYVLVSRPGNLAPQGVWQGSSMCVCTWRLCKVCYAARRHFNGVAGWLLRLTQHGSWGELGFYTKDPRHTFNEPGSANEEEFPRVQRRRPAGQPPRRQSPRAPLCLNVASLMSCADCMNNIPSTLESPHCTTTRPINRSTCSRASEQRRVLRGCPG